KAAYFADREGLAELRRTWPSVKPRPGIDRRPAPDAPERRFGRNLRAIRYYRRRRRHLRQATAHTPTVQVNKHVWVTLLMLSFGLSIATARTTTTISDRRVSVRRLMNLKRSVNTTPPFLGGLCSGLPVALRPDSGRVCPCREGSS